MNIFNQNLEESSAYDMHLVLDKKNEYYDTPKGEKNNSFWL
jgi:hypothetical protein